MMNKTELLEFIASQENSRVEFKRDDCRPDQLTKEMSALLNLEGGVILLGVEKDGRISGLTRSREGAEEWVMSIARNNLQPPTIPVWTSTMMEDGNIVGIVELPADSPSKPHKAKRGKAWVTYVRVGSVSREATREEEGRLYQAARLVRYEIKAVVDMGLDSLDIDRIENYLRDVLKRSVPGRTDVESWRRLLRNSDLLVAGGDGENASVAGLLLFGENPNRRLPQAGVTAAAFPGVEKDYNMIDEERIRGPLVSIISKRSAAVEKGVIDRTADFVKRNMGSKAWLEGARRRRKGAFPLEAVREAVVNAVAHRDYAREGTDVEVSLYADRLEVISPGRLPNGVTVEKMKEGVVRVARNELLKEILRDYRYIEHQGMGVRNRIIESMRRHNGTEPDLEEEDDRFVVRLWKDSGQAGTGGGTM
ncbi:MAG: putative DNA binding domain-containing protein [Candidatus Latescibacteria bacterium]|nr:putative DNA binding domain-containing protein [Candidatus Latescibacterota bacterium]